MSGGMQGHGAMRHNAEFKRRLRAGEPLYGAFVKTPHPTVVELLGQEGFDFLVLDAEHAPFERASIDMALLAARAVGCPTLVRPPAHREEWIMASLDAGAAGILAPRVSSAAAAETLAALMRYQGGDRGFSPSPRAAEYGRRGIAGHLAHAPEETTLICQIEDRAGVEAAAAIAAVEGVDGLFVGPVDLAVSCGFDTPAAEEVVAMCRRVIAAAPGASGLFTDAKASAERWRALGATLFVLASDQAFLRHGAAAALRG